MKFAKRPWIAVLVLVLATALAVSWMAADAGAPEQETRVPSEAIDEPLPDFQPSERLPADSAVAFPTDI